LAQKVVGATSSPGYGRSRLPTRDALGRGTLTQPNRESDENHTLLAVIAALLSLNAVSAGAASATTVDECQGRLMTLREHTLAAQASFTSQKDVGSLVAKVDAASAKLAAGKNTDAVAKLVDFQTTLNALATAPKPKVVPVVAQALSAEAQGVIVCINEIGAA
jgi:hypothetical protein